MESLTIGQLAKMARVNVETVRYYERRGLIPEPSRSESGYRQFSSEAVGRIRFIKRAQEQGFSLKEISELLNLRVDPNTTCGDVKRRARAKITDIEERMETLRTMKQALMGLIRQCRGEGPSSDCPILEALDTNKNSPENG